MENQQKSKKPFKAYRSSPEHDVKVSPESANTADSPSCIYQHQRYTVGSVIKSTDGPDSVCGMDGEWKNVGEPDNQIQ